jgi:hypothetical protein
MTWGSSTSEDGWVGICKPVDMCDYWLGASLVKIIRAGGFQGEHVGTDLAVGTPSGLLVSQRPVIMRNFRHALAVRRRQKVGD